MQHAPLLSGATMTLRTLEPKEEQFASGHKDLGYLSPSVRGSALRRVAPSNKAVNREVGCRAGSPASTHSSVSGWWRRVAPAAPCDLHTKTNYESSGSAQATKLFWLPASPKLHDKQLDNLHGCVAAVISIRCCYFCYCWIFKNKAPTFKGHFPCCGAFTLKN